MPDESRSVAPTREAIAPRDSGRSVANSDGTTNVGTVPTRGGIPVPPRVLPDAREPIAPRDSGRTIADIILPRYLADARQPIAPRDAGVSRGVVVSPTTPSGQGDASGTGGSTTPTQPDNQNAQTTPFDFGLGDWFKTLFNEPIQGSKDKQGEFVYIPGATSGGGNSLILVAVVGLGIGGYFLYQKYKAHHNGQ